MTRRTIALLGLVAASMGLANVAMAGPPVTITVKNQTPETATYYRFSESRPHRLGVKTTQGVEIVGKRTASKWLAYDFSRFVSWPLFY